MQAFILSDAYPGGRLSGELELSGSQLNFSSGDLVLHWPLSAIEVKKGGASNRLLMMECGLNPQICLCTSDQKLVREVLKDANAHPSFAALKKKSYQKTFLLLGILLAIVGFFAALWWSKDALVQALARQIPAAWEQKLSMTQIEAMKLSQGFSQDSVALAQVEMMAKPIIQAAQSSPHARHYNYQFLISSDPSVNAFALPGGVVVVNSGLILKADRVEEIQGVLAHEIAHAEKQHGMRNVLSSLGLVSLISIFTGGSDGALAAVIGQGSQLLTLKFSRDFEREADEVGFTYLVDQKIDPQGMRTFFEKLLNQPQGNLSKVMKELDFLSTHPATTERIQRLQKQEEGVKGPWNAPVISLKDLQARVKALR